jgi:hypothetical protein
LFQEGAGRFSDPTRFSENKMGPVKALWMTSPELPLDMGGPIERAFDRMGAGFADVPAIEHLNALERFSVDVNRNSKWVPKGAQIRFDCFDSNGEVARWRRDTRRTSGRGRSRLSKTARADGKRRGCSGGAPRPQTPGSVAALPGTGHSRSPLEAHRQWLLDLVAAEPDLTLEEIRARLKSEKRLKTGTTSVWRFYERHDITFKKNSARRRTGSP